MQEATAQGPETEAAAAAPENPFISNEETPAPQEAAPEETPSPEATETPWHHSVASDDELFGHDKLQSHRERLREEGQTEGRLQAQQELAPLLEGSSQEFSRFTQQLRSLYGRLSQAANEGGIDEAAVDRLLSAHPEAFDAMGKVVNREFKNQLGGEAYNNFLTALAQDTNDFQLVGEFAPRLAYAVRGMDKKFISDLRKRIVSKAVEAADQKGYERGLKEGRAAAAATQQVEQAATTGANLAPGRPAGGGKYTAEQWTSMTTAQRNKAREEGRHPLA